MKKRHGKKHHRKKHHDSFHIETSFKLQNQTSGKSLNSIKNARE